MIMELKLLPKDLMNQRECTEILSDYISSFKCVKNNQITTQYTSPALQGDGEVWGQTGKGTGPGTVLWGHQHNQVAPWLGNKEEKVWNVNPKNSSRLDDATWTQCLKWRWRWWSWTRRGTYQRASQTPFSTSWTGFTSTGLTCFAEICLIMRPSCLQDLNPHADIALQCIARTEYNSDRHGRWHSSTQRATWEFI